MWARELSSVTTDLDSMCLCFFTVFVSCIFLVSLFLDCIAINFPLRTAFAASHRFWVIMFITDLERVAVFPYQFLCFKS